METVNGLNAYVGTYRGDGKGTGKVLMRAAHISVGRQVYVVAGFAPGEGVRRDRSRAHAGRAFVPGVESRRGVEVNAATLAIMNDHEVSVQPKAGDRVKIVVEG